MIFPICTSVSLFIIFSLFCSTLLTSTVVSVSTHLFSILPLCLPSFSFHRVIDCEKVTRIFFTVLRFHSLATSNQKILQVLLPSLTHSISLIRFRIQSCLQMMFSFLSLLLLPPTTNPDEQMIFFSPSVLVDCEKTVNLYRLMSELQSQSVCADFFTHTSRLTSRKESASAFSFHTHIPRMKHVVHVHTVYTFSSLDDVDDVWSGSLLLFSPVCM